MVLIGIVGMGLTAIGMIGIMIALKACKILKENSHKKQKVIKK